MESTVGPGGMVKKSEEGGIGVEWTFKSDTAAKCKQFNRSQNSIHAALLK